MRSDDLYKPTVSLDAVNGWRGPGALAIAIAHFSLATDFVSVKTLTPLPLIVDMFFVFSGILIAKVYSDKLQNRGAIPEYLIRRFGRIWPVQVATLSVLVAYELAKLAVQVIGGGHFNAPAFATDGANLLQAIPTNLLLIHSLGIHDRETWNFPSWSLSVEFFTYGAFALLCLAKPVLRLSASAVTVGASIAILMLIAPYQMRSTFDYGIFRCLAGFFAGSLCYEALLRWPLPRWPMPTLVEVGALAIVIAWMVLSSETYFVFMAPLVFCGFIVAFVPQRGWLSRVLMMRPMQMMAELSFAIYMVHAVVLVLSMAVLREYERLSGTHLFITKIIPFKLYANAPGFVQTLHVGSPIAWLVGVSIYVVVVLTAAYAAYRMVEVPGRAFFGRLAKRFDARLPQPSTITTGSIESAS